MKSVDKYFTNTIDKFSRYENSSEYRNCHFRKSERQKIIDKGYIPKSILKKYSAEGQNLKNWWEKAIEVFPTCPTISGLNHESIEELNSTSLNIPKHFNLLDYFDKPKLSVLEIGCGYGGLQKFH